MRRTLKLTPQPMSKSQINLAVRSMLSGSLVLASLTGCGLMKPSNIVAVPCQADKPAPAPVMDQTAADRLQQEIDALNKALPSSPPTHK